MYLSQILSDHNNTIHQWKACLFSFQMMYKSKFRKIDNILTYNWFCGPGSQIQVHLKKNRISWNGLQVICIVGSGFSRFPLDNTSQILYEVQVWWVCWPVKHSNTMVIEPAFGTVGSVGRCQVLLENEISISIKLVSWRHKA